MNHSLLLATYYFFPICCTIPNNLKFFKHIANLTWKVNPKSCNHFGHFFMQIWTSELQLPGFSRAKKRIFVTSNANFLQSRRWKNLKFFPHLLKLVHYKILRLHLSKSVFKKNFDTCSRKGSFKAFFGDNIVKEL